MPVKIMILLKRKPGLTPEEFRHRYESSHSRLGLKYFGHLWISYKRNYLGAASPLQSTAGFNPDKAAAQTCPYDAIAEVVYRDMDALIENNRLMEDPAMKRLHEEDEATVFDRPNCWGIVCEEIDEEPIMASAKEGNVHTRAALYYEFTGPRPPAFPVSAGV